MDFFDKLFKHFGKIWVAGLVLGLAFWAAVIFVAVHFLAQVW
jgi:hypothetical protein